MFTLSGWLFMSPAGWLAILVIVVAATIHGTMLWRLFRSYRQPVRAFYEALTGFRDEIVKVVTATKPPTTELKDHIVVFKDLVNASVLDAIAELQKLGQTGGGQISLKEGEDLLTDLSRKLMASVDGATKGASPRLTSTDAEEAKKLAVQEITNFNLRGVVHPHKEDKDKVKADRVRLRNYAIVSGIVTILATFYVAAFVAETAMKTAAEAIVAATVARTLNSEAAQAAEEEASFKLKLAEELKKVDTPTGKEARIRLEKEADDRQAEARRLRKKNEEHNRVLRDKMSQIQTLVTPERLERAVSEGQ